MNTPKINPAVLRLLVIFPNIMSYLLLIGVFIYIGTNFEALRAAQALNFWVIIAVVLCPMAIFTTYSIVKRIRAGVL